MAIVTGAALAVLAPGAMAAQARTHQAAPTHQQESLGTLARQVRAMHARQERLHPPRVYTNANLPAVGHISVFGQAPAPAPVPAGTSTSKKAAPSQQAEADWQQQVAQAQRQLSLDQQALNVSQREWNLSQEQYYSNPNVALQQQYSRSDINQKAAEVKALQQKVQADQEHLQDLQSNPPPQP